jgi:hypothetical protein
VSAELLVGVVAKFFGVRENTENVPSKSLLRSSIFVRALRTGVKYW